MNQHDAESRKLRLRIVCVNRRTMWIEILKWQAKRTKKQIERQKLSKMCFKRNKIVFFSLPKY